MSDVTVGFCLPVFENFTWNWQISKRELQSQNAQTFFHFHRIKEVNSVLWHGFQKRLQIKKLMHF